MRNRDVWQTSQHRDTSGRVALPHNGYREDVKATVVEGAIVVLDRQPWRVLEIREKPEDLWPANYETAWQKKVTDWVEHEAARAAGEPHYWGAPRKPWTMPVRAEWQYRPINLVLQHAEKPNAKPRHITACVSRDWQVIPEHYSVCRLCRELPPCRHQELEDEVARTMAVSDRLMAIPRGACLGCGETITSRMKAVRFPGPNLWRPDWGTDSAVFHARAQIECSNGVWRYEQQWKQQGLDVLNPTIPEA
ncbi:hypothetical protein [Streptomyces himastatinicus]|uniref:hypothetical protein n=1 Tax=Streptomyces himastatinicus TaxID=998084 RepID=UPI00031E42DB|nr:hypothetical protein [Streptomyces himastatinicus]